jgi:hypothetical protein
MAEKLLPLAHHTFIAATVSTPASFPFEDAEKLLRPLLWLLLALFLGALLTALMAVGLFRRLSAWTGQPAASGRGVALGFCLWGIAAVLLISSWLRLLLPAGEELGGTAGRFSCICFGLAATAALIRALLP